MDLPGLINILSCLGRVLSLPFLPDKIEFTEIRVLGVVFININFPNILIHGENCSDKTVSGKLSCKKMVSGEVKPDFPTYR